MKPGGNYTQPVFDPITETLRFDIYVDWRLIDSKESDAEATQVLLDAVSARAEVVEVFASSR